MKRFKIWAGFTFSILALFILITSSKAQPVSKGESEGAILTTEPKKSLIDGKEAKLYRSRRQELQTALNAYFKKAIVSGDIVGAGVSIVKGDSIVISDGFGKKNSNHKDKVDGQTVFRLGSLSKGFAGVLAANLKNEGQLGWNDKVVDYIPEFQLGDKTNTDKITLATIMSHTSGTPYHSFTNLVEAGLPISDIAKRFDEVAPISAPGEQYSYQNAMFSLCGEVMQKATGQQITSLLDNRFFKPLGMHSVAMDYETLDRAENVAMPHVKSRNGFKSVALTDSYYNAVVAGGIDASALDMAKWMRFLLGHNPEVMSKAAIAEAFEPQIEINIGRKYYKRWPGHLASYYGFGWRIHTFENESTKAQETVWHHGGSVNRFRNEIAVYPEADLGICVLLNSNSRLARTVIPDLHRIVADIYGNEAPKLPNTPVEMVSLSNE